MKRSSRLNLAGWVMLVLSWLPESWMRAPSLARVFLLLAAIVLFSAVEVIREIEGGR